MRVALYARVSMDDGEQNPETQLRRLRAIAEARELSIVGEYVDRASGKTMRRAALTKILDDARHGRFDAVMILKIDRLSRSALDALVLLDSLRQMSIDLIITEEGIDTTSTWGRAIYSIIATIAELERNNISERTRLGLDRAKAEGKTLGRPPRKLSPHHIAKARRILEDSPEISHLQLSQQFEGVSRNTLIRELRKEGIL